MPDSRKPIRPDVSKSDSKLLDEIRENYDFDTDAFAQIREQGSEDIRYVANDPWPDKEKQARREAQRPMVSCDLLNQYCNQVINEVRNHPREVKISPAGYGATAKLAEFRENRIRAIQYKSDAQAAYITAMENCVQRGYGFSRVSLRYVSESSVEQEVWISRLPNPDAVLFDMACKELDCADAEHCYVLDQFTKAEFRRRWPKSEIIDFSGELARNYPQWIKDKLIQVAEYWRVEKKPDTVVQYQDENGRVTAKLLSELGGKLSDSMLLLPGKDGRFRVRRKVFNTRETHIRTVMQYITNGVEILEENEWLGKWIPIVPLWGKEFYLTEAGGSRRVLASLIRNARDAQMSYNYFKTCQTEAAGMVPKTNYLAIEGQFEGHEEEVAKATKVPTGYIYYKGKIPELGNELLPPPMRNVFDPPIQNLEVGAESFARAVQTAVGMYNTAVGAHDTNVKSGKAIQELDSQSDQGAFHFVDNFNRFIMAHGRIINDLISKIEVAEQEVTIRKADGTEAIVRINTDQPYSDENGQEHHYPMDAGEYSCTTSVGPTFDSQRDEAADFLDTFLSEVIPALQDPGQKNQLLALAIKLRQLGPIGDQMAEILVPPPTQNPQQTQMQVQALTQQLQALQQENQALHMDRAGRVLEQQTKIILQRMKEDGDTLRAQLANDIKVLLGEISAKAQSGSERTQMYKEFQLENHGAAHELAMQKDQQEHDAAQAATAQAANQQMAALQESSQAQPPDGSAAPTQ